MYQNAFRRIREATGVSEVSEVIQKVMSQEATTESLVALTRENAGKLETLNQQMKLLKAKVEEKRFGGPSSNHRRKAADDLEESLATAGMRLERARARYERLSRILVASKSGVEHLQNKLEVARE